MCDLLISLRRDPLLKSIVNFFTKIANMMIEMGAVSSAKTSRTLFTQSNWRALQSSVTDPSISFTLLGDTTVFQELTDVVVNFAQIYLSANLSLAFP